MFNSKKLATAALVGLLSAGVMSVGVAKANDGAEHATEHKAAEKNACAGKNSCKGHGGCKTDANACAGKNACKGKGGCATDGSKK